MDILALPVVDPKDIPAGYEYQWMPAGDQRWLADGWHAVSAERHWSAPWAKGYGEAVTLVDGFIAWTCAGMVLVQRRTPKESLNEEFRWADTQIQKLLLFPPPRAKQHMMLDILLRPIIAVLHACGYQLRYHAVFDRWGNRTFSGYRIERIR